MVDNTDNQIEREKKEWQSPSLFELNIKNTMGGKTEDTGEDDDYINIS